MAAAPAVNPPGTFVTVPTPVLRTRSTARPGFAGRRLFRALYPRAVALARLRLDPADAEDAAQSALERVFARANVFVPGRPALPWFYAVAANEVRAIARRRGRERGRLRDESAASAIAGDADPERDAVIAEMRSTVLRAVGELDEASAEAIYAVLGEAPPPSIGRAALRKRISRAYARLRVLMGGAP